MICIRREFIVGVGVSEQEGGFWFPLQYELIIGKRCNVLHTQKMMHQKERIADRHAKITETVRSKESLVYSLQSFQQNYTVPSDYLGERTLWMVH